jgi:hypothetical protein
VTSDGTASRGQFVAQGRHAGLSALQRPARTKLQVVASRLERGELAHLLSEAHLLPSSHDEVARPRHGLPKVSSRADVELCEHFAEMPLDGAGTDE